MSNLKVIRNTNKDDRFMLLVRLRGILTLNSALSLRKQQFLQFADR